MKCYVGIDLGSTTTKAVVLDTEGKVLGRGITNSRSNYDVACEVARNEAFLDTRFYLFSDRLDGIGELAEHTGTVLDALRRAFKLEQYLRQLSELESECGMNGERLPTDHLTALGEVFETMRERAPKIFAADAKPRSDFFRDIAGSDYMALSGKLAEQRALDHERLLGIYDKSIIAVEGKPPGTWLRDLMERALQRTLAEYPLPEGARERFQAEIQRSIDVPLNEAYAVGTGYGRARLPFPKECIRSEILCHGLGAHSTFPGTRTVLDIGGQDTKAIQVDGRGIVTSFQMNDRCAAGCGRYLGYIADEMNLGLHELGPLALCGKKPVRINSTCTVFAGAELRDRLAMGQRREDILAGLHRAIMLRAMSLLARSGGVEQEFTFTGGVANNEAAVAALRLLVEENYDIKEINISSESIYTGALGAALFALRAAHGETRPEELETVGGAR